MSLKGDNKCISQRTNSSVKFYSSERFDFLVPAVRMFLTVFNAGNTITEKLRKSL